MLVIIIDVAAGQGIKAHGNVRVRAGRATA